MNNDGWVRYEGHGYPVCPQCVEYFCSIDVFWDCHAYPFIPEPKAEWIDTEQSCHSCGKPAPLADYTGQGK